MNLTLESDKTNEFDLADFTWNTSTKARVSAWNDDFSNNCKLNSHSIGNKIIIKRNKEKNRHKSTENMQSFIYQNYKELANKPIKVVTESSISCMSTEPTETPKMYANGQFIKNFSIQDSEVQKICHSSHAMTNRQSSLQRRKSFKVEPTSNYFTQDSRENTIERYPGPNHFFQNFRLKSNKSKTDVINVKSIFNAQQLKPSSPHENKALLRLSKTAIKKSPLLLLIRDSALYTQQTRELLRPQTTTYSSYRARKYSIPVVSQDLNLSYH